MATYVYAICAAGPFQPTGDGLGDRPLRLVTAGQLTAVASDAVERPSPADEEDLWRHEEVVERLMEDRPVLPVRFGTVLDSDAVLQEMLWRRAGELQAALERVGGAVELSVRAGWRASAEPRSVNDFATGTGYLQALRERSRRAQQLRQRIQAVLGPLARESREQRALGARMQLRVAYLVESGRVDEFTDRVASLACDTLGSEIVCTGPWPPYSFAEAAEATG